VTVSRRDANTRPGTARIMNEVAVGIQGECVTTVAV
jgi:hypothetical protein